MSDAVHCGSGGGDDSSFGLRIASVFIILVGSTSGALFPVLAKRSSWLNVPKPIFEFVFMSFFLIMVFYNHTALPNTSVLESLYVPRPIKAGRFCLTYYYYYFKDCHSVHPSSRIWNRGTLKSMFISELGIICRVIL